MSHGALIGYINHRKSKSGSCTTAALLSYRLWDSNPHSFELDFESSASTNSAKSACGVCALKRECAAESREKQNYARNLGLFQICWWICSSKHANVIKEPKLRVGFIRKAT